MAKTLTCYTVTGSGQFPFWLLNFNSSYPYTPADAEEMGNTAERSITLCNSENIIPTPGIWEQGGWTLEIKDYRWNGDHIYTWSVEVP